MQVECAAPFPILLKNCAHDMNASPISAGCNEARHHGIVCAILRVEDNDVSDGCAALPTGPLSASRYSCGDIDRELAFAVAWLACNRRMLAACESAGPEKINPLRLNLRCASGYKFGTLGLRLAQRLADMIRRHGAIPSFSMRSFICRRAASSQRLRRSSMSGS